MVEIPHLLTLSAGETASGGIPENEGDDLGFGQTIRGFTEGQLVFNRYHLKTILGRGGMGVVWRGFDQQLQRDVALKFMPEMVRLDSHAVDELKRETRKSLDLTHPHIVRIYDFVQDAGSAAISMEFVDGPTLSAQRLVKPNRVFEPEEILDWVCQLCAALDYAHNDAKIVHRDLKPANLMLTSTGRLKVADFGISRSINDSVSRMSLQVADSSGTPAYMSPQQAIGTKPAPSDDIYSLGATIYDLLTGKPPFHSGNIHVQMREIVPPSMTARREEFEIKGVLPQAWEDLVAACLAKEPADRPQSAAEVLERLAGNLPPRRLLRLRSRFRKAVLLSTAGLLASGAGAGWYFGVYQPEQTRLEILQQEARNLTTKVSALLETGDKALAEKSWKGAIVAYRSALDLQARNEVAQIGLAKAQEGLAAVRGYLVFKYPPPLGTTISVDGNILGGENVLDKNGSLALTEGTHAIRIERPNYEPIEQRVTILNDNHTAFPNMTWQHRMARVAVTADPASLHLKLEPAPGQPDLASMSLPASGNSAEVPTGQYDVFASLDGLVWKKARALTLEPGPEAAIAHTWPRSPVTVTSTPANAAVFLRDATGKEELLGTTPLTKPMLAGTTPDLSVRLDGYQDASVKGTVKEDAPLALAATLQKNPPAPAKPSPPRSAPTPRPAKSTASTQTGKPKASTSSNPVRQGIENQYRRGQITRDEYLNAINNL